VVTQLIPFLPSVKGPYAVLGVGVVYHAVCFWYLS
jgi:hypothetical protein